MTAPDGAPAGHWSQARELRTRQARVVADIASVGNDLDFVASAAERLLVEMSKPEGESDSVLVRALWSAALVAYKRCFSDGKRSGLKLDDVRQLPFDGVIEWHQFLLQMRDKHVAHSVNPYEDVRVGAFVDDDGRVIGTGHLSIMHLTTTEQGVRQLGHLARSLLAAVKERYDTELAKLTDAAAAMSAESLARLKPLVQVVPGPDRAGVPREVA